jgi:hypothetical protein
LAKVAKRVDDDDVMHLLKIILKANGRCGVPQGGVGSVTSSRCGGTRICLFAKYTDPFAEIAERGAQVRFAGSELVGNTRRPPSKVLLSVSRANECVPCCGAAV